MIHDSEPANHPLQVTGSHRFSDASFDAAFLGCFSVPMVASLSRCMGDSGQIRGPATLSPAIGSPV
jgi:hypothetical protein